MVGLDGEGGGEELRSLEDLRNSGFGWPHPRHGLHLLYWFAKECVVCHGQQGAIELLCDAEMGDYGFHRFNNFEEILPLERGVYFMVGNLNARKYPGAASLPAYVREAYLTVPGSHLRNIDRVVIRIRKRKVRVVYVLEHWSERSYSGGFDPRHTRKLSPELLRTIQDPGLQLITFLQWTGYTQNPDPSTTVYSQDLYPSQSVYSQGPSPSLPVYSQDLYPSQPVYSQDLYPSQPVYSQDPSPSLPVYSQDLYPSQPVYSQDPSPYQSVYRHPDRLQSFYIYQGSSQTVYTYSTYSHFHRYRRSQTWLDTVLTAVRNSGLLPWTVDGDEDEEEKARRRMKSFLKALKAFVVGASMLFLAGAGILFLANAGTDMPFLAVRDRSLLTRCSLAAVQKSTETPIMLDYTF